MTDIGVEIQDERGWVVVATPRVVMLVHASEGEPRVASLRAVAEDGSLDDVLQILTEGGILETPDFVAIESGTPVRVVARGGGYAVLTSRDADSPSEVRATGRTPWADEDAPADLAHVSLRCVPSVTRPTGYVASTAPATLAGAIAESAAHADRHGLPRSDSVGASPRADGESGRVESGLLESGRSEPAPLEPSEAASGEAAPSASAAAPAAEGESAAPEAWSAVPPEGGAPGSPRGPVGVEAEAASVTALPDVQSRASAPGDSLDVPVVESPVREEEPTAGTRRTTAPGGAQGGQQPPAGEIPVPVQPRREAPAESPRMSGDSVDVHPSSAEAGESSREEGVVASPFVERTTSWSPAPRPVQAASPDKLANGERPRASGGPEPSESASAAGEPSSAQEPTGLAPPAGAPQQPSTSAPTPASPQPPPPGLAQPSAPPPPQPGQLSGAGPTSQARAPAQGGEPAPGGQPSQGGPGAQAARLDQTGQPPQSGQPSQTGQPPQAAQPPQSGQPSQTGQPPQAAQPPQTGQSPQTGQPPQAAQPPPAARQPPGPQVLAVMCPAGHPNPPHLSSCRLCQQHIPPQQPVHVPRPSLGVLRLSTGDVVTLDRGVVLGRSPQLRPDLPPGSRPHVLRLPSPQNDISRTHAEVILEGWHVMVRDLGSTNGTTVTLPGYEPARLRPTDQPVLEPGTVVTLADEITMTYEVRA